jgi:peptidoglycan L-alanyl-D-glutamate endopeptidase CwlK
MASTNPDDLIPEIQSRFEWGLYYWKTLFPAFPVPRLTATYRSGEEQNRLYSKGRSAGGSIVTNAKAGDSLHNYFPALAFDVVFVDNRGRQLWDWKWYELFAQIMKGMGMAWGGDWKSVKDGAHFEPPNYSPSKARAKVYPSFPDPSIERAKELISQLGVGATQGAARAPKGKIRWEWY